MKITVSCSHCFIIWASTNNYQCTFQPEQCACSEPCKCPAPTGHHSLDRSRSLCIQNHAALGGVLLDLVQQLHCHVPTLIREFGVLQKPFVGLSVPPLSVRKCSHHKMIYFFLQAQLLLVKVAIISHYLWQCFFFFLFGWPPLWLRFGHLIRLGDKSWSWLSADCYQQMESKLMSQSHTFNQLSIYILQLLCCSGIVVVSVTTVKCVLLGTNQWCHVSVENSFFQYISNYHHLINKCAT